MRVRFLLLLLVLAVPLAAQPATQPAGALSGRIVFIGAGHGWTFANESTSPRWYTQRGVANSMVEDYGNLDQMNLFAEHLWRAGATVVPTRPLGFQTNEVVLDNTSASVRFAGAWSTSIGPIFYGEAGTPAYRFAAVASTETATATYTPAIPAAGLYPVYTWVAHGGNRVAQLYRVRHSGGETHVRIPHHRVGNGWVWLGNFHFNAGTHPESGSVVISNQSPPGSSPTAIVVADALRFGNGMGSIARGPDSGDAAPRVSGFPREEEAARYWIEAGLGQGQSTALFDRPGIDDGDDNVGAPIRLVREMNREVSGTTSDRVYLSFHSNAGGGRGVLGLWNDNTRFPSTGTANQRDLALGLAAEIQSAMQELQAAGRLETPWFTRSRSALTFARTDFAFGEIRNDVLGGEMDATIVECAFHDSVEDALLLRSPIVRDAMARATLHGLIRHFATVGAGPIGFPPSPPIQVRAIAHPEGIRVAWNAATNGFTPTHYVVQRSTDGRGFGHPLAVTNALDVLLTDVPAGSTAFFRIVAVNAGGESAPSAVVACRWDPEAPRVLLVDAFDRQDRFLNPRQILQGPVIERVQPARSNGRDSLVEHALALAASGVAFDSGHSHAVGNGRVPLAAYDGIVWAAGNESTADETFSANERSRVTAFQQAGGALLVSGAEIAWHLGKASGPTAAERQFLASVLHAALRSDADDDAGTDRFRPTASGPFRRLSELRFGTEAGGRYAVRFPDVLTPEGNGASTVLEYVGGRAGAAAIAYDGTRGGGRTVLLGFPFETLATTRDRTRLMADALDFLGLLPRTILDTPELLPTGQWQVRTTAIPGRLHQLQTWSGNPSDPWINLGSPRLAEGPVLEFNLPELDAPVLLFRLLRDPQ